MVLVDGFLQSLEALPPDRPPPPEGRGLPPDSYSAQPPPRGEHDAPFDPFADDNGCANAFATTAVDENGVFELHHLWPGAYQLVFYGADGTRFNDAAAEVMLNPGQAIDGLGQAGLDVHGPERRHH